MVHLGVEDSFRQGLLQIVEQPVRVENRLWVGASQQLVEDSVRYARVFASRHRWAPSPDHAQPPHEIPDSPAQAFAELEAFDETATHADWLAPLVDRELTHRRDKRLAARLRYARLRQQASVEDVDY